MAVPATGYVQRRAFGAARSDRDDRRASLIRPAMQKHKLVLDFERDRERQMGVRKNNAKLPPLVPETGLGNASKPFMAYLQFSRLESYRPNIVPRSSGSFFMDIVPVPYKAGFSSKNIFPCFSIEPDSFPFTGTSSRIWNILLLSIYQLPLVEPKAGNPTSLR